MPELEHYPIAEGFFTPRLGFDIIRRNLWVFIQSVFGVFPGLDPEQEGKSRFLTQADCYTSWLLFAWMALTWWSGLWGLLFWLISPMLPFFIFDLKGPRVWLSRWYVPVLGVVLMVSGAPAFVRWGMLAWWSAQTIYYSRFYRSDLLFYEQVKRENPNRDHYRIDNLAYCLLEAGRHSEAEDEFQAVLKADPDNVKASFFVNSFAVVRRYTAEGKIGVSFRCTFCNAQAFGLLEDGERITWQDHLMFWFQVCPQCGKSEAKFSPQAGTRS